jgi:CRISPR/Cas system-associated exonuclease Cas4 (RecB family)
MSRYLAKKKYPQYMNAIEKINVAEHIILKSFLGFIDDLINAEFIKNRDELLEIMKKARAEKKRIEKET